ncbi:MAG: RidA family protein [Candidatus Methanofastidiosa archaeon]|jgi:2-iminobutanoate/2-iminopropanoate deaminase|nr:RidA family protein [Candidatus Methanofastidiosa archaeon]
MLKKKLETNNAPTPVGPYSQGIVAGDFVFVSGQIPIQKSGEIVLNNIEKATDVVLDNIEAILREENLSLKDVIKSEVYLKDINNFEKFNKIYEKRFSSGIKPTRVTVEVSKLPKNSDIEISCVAYKNDK